MSYLLMVEDDASDAELMQYAVRRSGYAGDIVWTRTGEQALAQLGQSPLPLFVLLDLGLAGMDGSVVLARIRFEARTRDLPVVVCTGSRFDIPHIIALGVRDYVVKSPEMYGLITVMQEIFAKAGC